MKKSIILPVVAAVGISLGGCNLDEGEDLTTYDVVGRSFSSTNGVYMIFDGEDNVYLTNDEDTYISLKEKCSASGCRNEPSFRINFGETVENTEKWTIKGSYWTEDRYITLKDFEVDEENTSDSETAEKEIGNYTVSYPSTFSINGGVLSISDLGLVMY